MPIVLGLLVFILLAGVLTLGLLSVTTDPEVKRTLARLESISMAGSRGKQDEVLEIRRQELLSALPWLNRWLQATEFTPRLRLLLYQADLKWTVGAVLLMSVLSGLVGAYLAHLRTGAELFAVMVGVACGAAPFGYVYWKRSVRFSKFEQGLPEALDLMVSAIRAGHSFASAMGMVSKESPEPLRREFRQCFEEQNFGLELRTAMENLATRVPIHDVRVIVTAVLIQKESGGNITEILEKVAHVIREGFRLKRQIAVHTAQGRLTGWILSLLPAVLGVGLYLVNPEHMSLLWKHPTGLKITYAAVIMTAIGALIIRKIVRLRV